jgi:hypothetical protein
LRLVGTRRVRFLTLALGALLQLRHLGGREMRGLCTIDTGFARRRLVFALGRREIERWAAGP